MTKDGRSAAIFFWGSRHWGRVVKLIQSVRVRGFRSIADATLEEIGNHVVVVGKNSSGKSNFLRALNLFFSGEPSPGEPLDFARDHHYRPSRRQKKEITVEVSFRLPERFNYRKELDRLHQVGSQFTIKKTWSLDRLRAPTVEVELLSGDVSVEGGSDLARDFLSLITFRYVPNRTVPAQVLRDESQQIAAAIFRKIKEGDKATDVLKGLAKSAEQLLSPTADALQESGAPISKPNVATAETLGQMLQMSGFQATGLNGATVRDEDWGAGHQAFFLLNLLRAIDTDYSRQFGWKQACIWAVEEPESGLHHDLQTRLARQLAVWTADATMRMQLFTTTHSAVVTMAGDSGYLVDIGETASSFTPLPIAKLVRAAEERGVSSYLHPILAFPFDVVVLVEGHIDEQVLNHVARVLGIYRLRFLSLPMLDGSESGGVDSQMSYVRKNSKFISRRLPEAPFVVLVDWEVAPTKVTQLRSAYGQGGPNRVLQVGAELANPVLGESFRGIERFYPSSVLRSAHDDGELAIAFPSRSGAVWSVSADELDGAKGSLMQRVLSESDPANLTFLANIVVAVDRTTRL